MSIDDLVKKYDKLVNPDNITLRWCSTCDKYVDKDKFHKDSSKKDGYASSCRDCVSVKRKLKRAECNLQKIKDYLKKSVD